MYYDLDITLCHVRCISYFITRCVCDDQPQGFVLVEKRQLVISEIYCCVCRRVILWLSAHCWHFMMMSAARYGIAIVRDSTTSPVTSQMCGLSAMSHGQGGQVFEVKSHAGFYWKLRESKNAASWRLLRHVTGVCDTSYISVSNISQKTFVQ